MWPPSFTEFSLVDNLTNFVPETAFAIQMMNTLPMWWNSSVSPALLIGNSDDLYMPAGKKLSLCPSIYQSITPVTHSLLIVFLYYFVRIHLYIFACFFFPERFSSDLRPCSIHICRSWPRLRALVARTTRFTLNSLKRPKGYRDLHFSTRFTSNGFHIL